MQLLPLYLVNFIGALGFSIVIPFLVFWLTEFGGSLALYGMLGSFYSIFQLFGSPILGRLSDKYGRKKLLFASHLGTLAAWLGILLAINMPVTVILKTENSILGAVAWTIPLILLFIARSVDGLTGGNISIANAMLADLTSDVDRTKNYGRMSAASSLGFIFGPSIAGIAGSDTYAVYIAIFVSLIGLFSISFFLPKTSSESAQDFENDENCRVLGKEIKDCKKHNVHGAGFFDLLKKDHIPTRFIFYFVTFFAFNIFYSTFPVQAKNELIWTPKELGYFFSFMSVVMIAVQVFLLPRANAFFKEDKSIIIGGLSLALSMWLLVDPQNYKWAVAVLFAIGNGLLWPSFMSLFSSLGTKSDQGSLQGYGSSIGSFASICGLFIGSVLYSAIGSSVFILPTVLFILAILLEIFLLFSDKRLSVE